jgi:hypothetical protein
MILCAMLLCRFNGIEILQGRWQHGEKVGYCCSSGLEKTLCKWEIYVSLVTKGLNKRNLIVMVGTLLTVAHNMRQLCLFVAVFNVY